MTDGWCSVRVLRTTPRELMLLRNALLLLLLHYHYIFKLLRRRVLLLLLLYAAALCCCLCMYVVVLPGCIRRWVDRAYVLFFCTCCSCTAAAALLLLPRAHTAWQFCRRFFSASAYCINLHLSTIGSIRGAGGEDPLVHMIPGIGLDTELAPTVTNNERVRS